ncbi:MAG: helix-turn-helix domain-containing protein [Opitutaceae bacterium]
MQFKDCIKAQIQKIILAGLQENVELLNAARDVAGRPAKGWLRAIREAIGLTQREAAAKTGVKRQTYAQFEASEERGAVSIESLRRAAESMDCELVYFVVPRGPGARTYADLAAARDPNATLQRATDHSMALRGGVDPDDAP